MDWKRVVVRIAAEVEDRVDRIRLERELRSGQERPVRVAAYRGYGTAERVRVRGRVVRGELPPAASPQDRWWVNLANTYRRLESDEVAGARIRVRYRGGEVEAATGEEGFFDAEVAPLDVPPADRLWHDATVELLDPAGQPAIATVAVPQAPEFGIISDLDDTVVRTEATSLVRMAREVLFGNAHTRIPFPGVGAFYRALHRHGGSRPNPLFYVSSSPWNLYDMLAEFLRLHDIPAGPMDLRDWGLSRKELLPVGHADHKRAAIDRILDTYDPLPFILVGDSGQEDPEIYRAVVRDHPERVLAVYIRSVVPDPLRIRAVRALAAEIQEHHHEGPELVLVETTTAAAEHAARRGWIDRGWLDEVGRARAAEA